MLLGEKLKRRKICLVIMIRLGTALGERDRWNRNLDSVDIDTVDET